MDPSGRSRMFRRNHSSPRARISLCFGAILLAAVAGCEAQPTLVATSDSIAIRLIASPNSNETILNAAAKSTDRTVSIDAAVVAQWIPFQDRIASDLVELDKVVTRQSQTGTELLVLHGDDDITGDAIKSIQGFLGSTGEEKTLITLTDAGSTKTFAFTVNNVGQRVALIVNEELRAAPTIVSPVRMQMVVTSNEIDKVRIESAK